MIKWEIADLRYEYAADEEMVTLRVCSALGNSYDELYMSLEDALAQMGDKGWELVTSPLWWWFYFKRPIED